MSKLKPNYKNINNPGYGIPSEKQHQLTQELTKPHIESFNYFIHEGLNKIVENSLPLEFSLPNGDRVALSIQDATLTTPKVHDKAVHPRTVKVYPAECRGRGGTYRGQLQVQIGLSVNGIICPPVTRNIGNIPIMVKSDACNLARLSPRELIKRGEEAEEMGGYFITNGIERIIRMLILPRRNFPMCINRPSWKGRGSFYTEFGIIIRCVRPDQTGTNMTQHYLNNGTSVLNFNHNKEMFFAPVIIVLKALMSVSDKFIYDELVKGNEDDSFYKGCIINMLQQTLKEGLLTKTAVLEYMGQRFRFKLRLPEWKSDLEVGTFLLQRCICTHLTSDVDKFNLIVYMTKKLFAFAKGKCAAESSDNPMNQEVLLGGHLYQMTLKEKLELYLASLRSTIERMAKSNKAGADRYRLTPDTFQHACNYGMDLSKPMEYLLATGNLISHSGLALMQASGMTVVADKLNFLRYVSHFRCIHRGAFFAEMRTTAVRKLLPEAWGFLCPVHTPDGSPCGLLNHLSALCQVQCVNYPVTSLIKLLYSLGVCPIDSPPGPVAACYTVLMDGKMLGYISDDLAEKFEQKLRVMKVNGLNKVPPTTEVCLVKKSEFASQYPGVYIFTTPARMVRPVINLAHDKIEMIGTFEQVYMDICITKAEAHPGITTHQEVDETSMLSFVAQFTPYSDHNQSPRNMYQCQMGKQTMGTPLHALKYRSDNKLYKLQTPQTPTVRPIKHDEYNVDNYPLGTNAIVAVVSYTGYDMEDAMVINKSSFERGFCHSSVYKSEPLNLDKITGEIDRFIFACHPTHEHVMDGKLNVDGLPPIGTHMVQNSPFYSYINIHSGDMKVVPYKSSEPSWVEHIRICGNDKGTGKFNRVSIMLRIDRNPIIGDKFASRHGQKGVCSMMYPVENMPFTESGMTPDIIFNPHGYPSRMTIGMMIESMAGKAACSYGDCYDATPFMFSEKDPAIDYFGNMLVKAGYNYYGTERFYSGTDGRELEADIFMGVVYYQRLRHMVSDKFQVRTTGPVDALTQQPVKGRKRGGGVRFGEMERDALISHGTTFLLQDRLLNCSDKSMVITCTKCGSLLSASMEKQAASTAAISHEKQRYWTCMLCKSSKHMKVITVPYVFRYLVYELAAMNIRVDLDVKAE